MPISEPEHPQDLKFPPVRVDRSLTKLDLETLMMRSTPRRQPEEVGSSLEDSNYDLLGDSVMDTSDDEAHTASIASTDGPTPDDTSDDFSDDDSEYGTDDRGFQDSVHSSHVERPEQHVDAHPTASGEDSTLTEVPPYLAGSESSWPITLDEEPTDTAEVRQGSKVIQSMADHPDEKPQVFSRYPYAQLRMSIKAALSQRFLPTPDAYRILYIGGEEWAQNIITSQIGAALAASPNTSKSVMVRGQIEPYAPVPQADRCVEFHVGLPHEKPSCVLAFLEKGGPLKIGPGMDAHSPGRPDLVVICRPTVPDSATDTQDFASASQVFASENIPCIELTSAKPYGAGSLTNDPTSLRVCVEGRNDPNVDYELAEVLPLDYYRFSRLQPSQLNRHLALISPHLMTAEGAEHVEQTRASWVGEKVNAFTKRTGLGWYFAKMVLSALVLSTLIPAVLHGAAYAPMLFQKAATGGLQSAMPSEITSIVPTITSIVSAPSSVIPPISSVTSRPSIPSVPQGLTIVPARQKQSKRTCKAKGSKVGGFELDITGDHKFVLRPSDAFNARRKKPQLQIQVSRQAEVVPVRYNRTMAGIYIVDLEQQYPFDVFNVSIATHSKPLLRQSFEVMLGHNKSTLDQLLDTAKSGLLNTQHRVWNVSSVAAQHVRVYKAGLETASERLHRVQRKVQHRLEMNALLAKQVPKATWMGLRKATAPVRTSTPMKRARMNALRVRCKVEMATGLSAKDTDGKQSWACSKVRGEV
jgi:hypothetical protein